VALAAGGNDWQEPSGELNLIYIVKGDSGAVKV
jgi:hypothetical protein